MLSHKESSWESLGRPLPSLTRVGWHLRTAQILVNMISLQSSPSQQWIFQLRGRAQELNLKPLWRQLSPLRRKCQTVYSSQLLIVLQSHIQRKIQESEFSKAKVAVEQRLSLKANRESMSMTKKLSLELITKLLA